MHSEEFQHLVPVIIGEHESEELTEVVDDSDGGHAPDGEVSLESDLEGSLSLVGKELAELLNQRRVLRDQLDARSGEILEVMDAGDEAKATSLRSKEAHLFEQRGDIEERLVRVKTTIDNLLALVHTDTSN